MAWKGMGMALVVAGIVHTGMGIWSVSAMQREVAVIGFVSLLLGGLLYLLGAIEQLLAERGRRPPRE